MKYKKDREDRDDFHSHATDPEVQFQILRNKLDEAPWSGNFTDNIFADGGAGFGSKKTLSEPSKPRKPPFKKRKRVPEDDEKTKGGKRKGAQKQRQRGRGSTTDTFPDSSPSPGGVSSLDLANSRVKPSKRGKPSRVARARARARGKGLYANKDDWKYMEQDEKDAYLQELAKRPPEVAEILLKALPTEAREAYDKGPKTDENAYNFYPDEENNDPSDDTQDEDNDTDDDEESAEEERDEAIVTVNPQQAMAYTDEWISAIGASDDDDDTNDYDYEGRGDDESESDEVRDYPLDDDADDDTNGYDDEADQDGDHDTEETVDDVYDDEQEQEADDDYQEPQDSDDDESSDVETEGSSVEPGYSAYDDYQSFHEAAWGEVDSEGTDHADV